MKARVPGGGGPSMNQMLKQAQKMQEDMAALQAELETREYDISAGGGVVQIKINGRINVLIKPVVFVNPVCVKKICLFALSAAKYSMISKSKLNAFFFKVTVSCFS